MLEDLIPLNSLVCWVEDWKHQDVQIWCKEDAIYVLLIYLAVFTYVTVAMSFMEIIEAQLNQYEIWAAFGWHYIVGV